MKSNAVLMMICFICFSVVSCGNNDEYYEKTIVDANSGEEKSITIECQDIAMQESVFSRHGHEKIINKAQIEELINDEKDIANNYPLEIKVGKDCNIQINKITQRFDEPIRVSPIYKNAASIGANSSVEAYSKVECDIKTTEQKKTQIIEALEKNFGLCCTGESKISGDTLFQTDEKDLYYAVVFYPEIYELKGIYSDNGMEAERSIVVTCCLDDSTLDGIYSVYEAEKVDVIPDCQKIKM